jgi:hypothetical protein
LPWGGQGPQPDAKNFTALPIAFHKKIHICKNRHRSTLPADHNCLFSHIFNSIFEPYFSTLARCAADLGFDCGLHELATRLCPSHKWLSFQVGTRIWGFSTPSALENSS